MMATARVRPVACFSDVALDHVLRSLTVCSPNLLCHMLLCACRPRQKHPLDMRMPLLFDDGPPSSTPSHTSPSGDSRSSTFGDLAAPTSQGVPADAWRSSKAGSRDRALWGSEALLEAPEMQNAQQLVGESICSLQVGEHACIKHLVRLLCWGEHLQPAGAGLRQICGTGEGCLLSWSA